VAVRIADPTPMYLLTYRQTHRPSKHTDRVTDTG